MDNKRIIILVILCAIALVLTGELTYVFYKANFLVSAAPSFCTINSTIDCDGVAKTSYALFLGVPLALWGTLLYLTVLFLTTLDFLKQKFTNVNNFFFDVFKHPRSYIAVLGLLSFIISMCLAFISLFKIQKICALCFVTYFLDLIIAFVAKTPGSFFGTDIKNTVEDFIDGAKKHTKLLILAIVFAIALFTYTSFSYVFSPHMKQTVMQTVEEEMKKASIQEFRDMKENIFAISGNQLGEKNAKIQIYIYSDFLCPFCKLTNIMLHKLVAQEKDIEIHHVNFPLDVDCNPMLVQSIHPGACVLAKYALAAEKQGNYWGMVSAIYNEMPSNDEQILKLAEKIGLDKDKLFKDAHSQEVEEILHSQIKLGQNNQVQGTPSMSINGILYAGGMSYEEILKLVNQAKARWERDNADLLETLESIGEAK